MWQEWDADFVPTNFFLGTAAAGSPTFQTGVPTASLWPNPVKATDASYTTLPAVGDMGASSNAWKWEWDPKNVPPGDLGKFRFYPYKDGPFK